MKPKSLHDLYAPDCDSVIDVRSPAEFAEDHLPGAINLPVLDNEERAQVGYIYKQKSPFAARKIGAALVFENAAKHISGPLMDKEGAWRPLVYCWRGGQRSNSFAWMLGQIGWRADLIEGGYRSYRRLVNAMLYEGRLSLRPVLLGGFTGTAKTALLPLLEARGVQVLDLEGLARHRGSLLGRMPGGQPGQKAFETALAQALYRLDPTRPVLIEAESSKIGEINLPPALWDAMKTAPMIEITAPLEARAAYLAGAYEDILADSETLRARLAPLRYHRGHAVVDHWEELIERGDRLALCKALAADHYDPAYQTARRCRVQNILSCLQSDGLGPADLIRLAAKIEEVLLGERLYRNSIGPA